MRQRRSFSIVVLRIVLEVVATYLVVAFLIHLTGRTFDVLSGALGCAGVTALVFYLLYDSLPDGIKIEDGKLHMSSGERGIKVSSDFVRKRFLWVTIYIVRDGQATVKIPDFCYEKEA